MNDTEIDHILENMFLVLPVFHKKLLRMDLNGVSGDLTRLHLAIMGMLRKKSMTASDLAKIFAIPKSQMTHLLDKLVAMDIIERQPAAEDRRAINLVLTDNGRNIQRDMKSRVRENIKERLKGLSDSELEEMSGALEILKKIGSQL